MTTDLLSCVEIDPAGKPIAVIIWLHGIGADGYDFEPIVPQLRLPENLPVRFVFPHAPKREITLHGGIPSRAWFDILGNEWPRTLRTINFDDLQTSAAQVEALIQRELDAGIPSEKIILAGFSQGGVVALHTGLNYEKPLGGIMALSTYLPTIELLESGRSEANLKIPVMMAHGTVDPVVPVSSGIMTRDSLLHLGYPVEWYEYYMVHSVCVDEIEDIRSWLMNVI